MTSVAVVTGAGSGIGLTCCRRLLAAGWSVYALDRHTGTLDAEAAASGSGSGTRLKAMACDVADEAAVRAAFEEIGRATEHIDALVCSAGVLRTGPLTEMPAEDFDAVFRVNTRGAWLCARSAMPLLARGATAEAPARMVMIASIAAVRPKTGGGAYAASKVALAQLVRVMAVEVASRHVRVNAVAPSTVDTPMIRQVGEDSPSGYRPSGVSPLGRVATPDDVVRVIEFLLSTDSDYVTGAVIPVDGGISAAIIPP
ncbi:SDR family oxidoreductase [Streptomyces sp. HNM0575]|uniref:SDR family oxidoreductase n=1 Tax=Streptomyces sp. HNM0575 TaxID=2716338 RepID=UPI00145EBA09|nr:SDR family oxidoreductase [Streptomyces sp. HNM0575]